MLIIQCITLPPPLCDPPTRDRLLDAAIHGGALRQVVQAPVQNLAGGGLDEAAGGVELQIEAWIATRRPGSMCSPVRPETRKSRVGVELSQGEGDLLLGTMAIAAASRGGVVLLHQRSRIP